jgi:hypothetical protein
MERFEPNNADGVGIEHSCSGEHQRPLMEAPGSCILSVYLNHYDDDLTPSGVGSVTYTSIRYVV